MNRILDVFLLAVIPGLIVVFGLSFLYYSASPFDPSSLYQATNTVLTAWESFSLTRKATLLGCCLIAGLLLRGFNRATLNVVESRFEGPGRTYWYQLAAGVQILLAPITMLREVIGLLGGDGAPGAHTTKYQDATLGELLRTIGWSSIICLDSIALFILAEGITVRRLGVIAMLWVFSGASFVLGNLERAREAGVANDEG